jgi:hypothetical protein
MATALFHRAHLRQQRQAGTVGQMHVDDGDIAHRRHPAAGLGDGGGLHHVAYSERP